MVLEFTFLSNTTAAPRRARRNRSTAITPSRGRRQEPRVHLWFGSDSSASGSATRQNVHPGCTTSRARQTLPAGQIPCQSLHISRYRRHIANSSARRQGAMADDPDEERLGNKAETRDGGADLGLQLSSNFWRSLQPTCLLRGPPPASTLHTVVPDNATNVSPPRWCYDCTREEATSSIQQTQTGIGGEESDHFLLHRTGAARNRPSGPTARDQHEQLCCFSRTERSQAY